MTRIIIFLILFVASVLTSLGQTTPKIKYTISNGLQIEGVDESNAFIYDNDMVEDTPEDEYLWLKYNQGKLKLVGNIITRNMDRCNLGPCKYTMQQTIDQWNKVTAGVKAAGIKMVTPTSGSDAMLQVPSSLKIEDTKWKSSAGADLIIREALKCSKEKPLVILIGGQATTVANAYLKNPSIADKIIVFHSNGYRDSPNVTRAFNTIDAWSCYIVMKKIRYINFGGDEYSWYRGKNVNLTQTMINSLPNNHMANSIKKWYSNFFAVESIGDAPPALYFYNHSLWKNVIRKLENGQTTTSDNFDYLLISANDWTNYGPEFINYLKDPNSYLQSSNNKPPTINLTSPANNSNYQAGASINIIGNASDTDGSITKVEFYNGTVKLGEDLTSPYTFQWNNVPAGSYTLTAKATDNQGTTATSSIINIKVNTPNTAPSVSISGPVNNASFSAGSAITLSANATDKEGSVTKIEFYQGTTKLGEDLTSPYTFQWNNVPAGSYTLTAKATDNQGATATSPIINIKVNIPANTAPTVSITSPENNSSFSVDSTVKISANAADKDGSVSKVEFYQGATKLGEDMVSPYSFEWTNVSVGNYSITAKAIDDKGAVTTSTAINIVILESINVPSIVITAPDNDATFVGSEPITIFTDTKDSNGIVSKVEFYIGETKIGESITAPYTFVWSDPSFGNHSIIAKAFDNQSVISVSLPITISVVEPVTIVSIEITSPVNNTTFVSGLSIEITAETKISNGAINKVEFFNGDQKLAEDLTSPFGYIWSNIPSGNHELIAKATTDQNTIVESKVIHVVVTEASEGIPVVAENIIPRYFTPNDDGLNDTWEFAEHELLENARVMVFNRSGQKIFEGYTYQDPWDGKLEGKPLEEDAYYYIIRLSDSNDIKGAVRIIR